jgi:hypothetical protein
MELRIPGPEADRIVGRLVAGLQDAEFAIPGQIVADIGLERPAETHADGSIGLFIEALTICE